jgi:hypothetical protein
MLAAGKARQQAQHTRGQPLREAQVLLRRRCRQTQVSLAEVQMESRRHRASAALRPGSPAPPASPLTLSRLTPHALARCPLPLCTCPSPSRCTASGSPRQGSRRRARGRSSRESIESTTSRTTSRNTQRPTTLGRVGPARQRGDRMAPLRWGVRDHRERSRGTTTHTTFAMRSARRIVRRILP